MACVCLPPLFRRLPRLSSVRGRRSPSRGRARNAQSLSNQPKERKGRRETSARSEKRKKNNFFFPFLFDVFALPDLTMTAAAASPKKKGSSKPKKAASHPPYASMVKAAVCALKERNGSSRQAILKYIMAHYNLGSDSKAVNSRLKVALRSGIKKGTLKHHGKATGANGSFKMAEKAKAAKPKAKKPAKKAAKKKSSPKKKKAAPKPSGDAKKSPKKKAAKKAKKPAAKKAKTPKKTVAKKPKAAKKPAAKKSPKKAAKKVAKK